MVCHCCWDSTEEIHLCPSSDKISISTVSLTESYLFSTDTIRQIMVNLRDMDTNGSNQVAGECFTDLITILSLRRKTNPIGLSSRTLVYWSWYSMHSAVLAHLEFCRPKWTCRLLQNWCSTSDLVVWIHSVWLVRWRDYLRGWIAFDRSSWVNCPSLSSRCVKSFRRIWLLYRKIFSNIWACSVVTSPINRKTRRYTFGWGSVWRKQMS